MAVNIASKQIDEMGISYGGSKEYLHSFSQLLALK